MIDFLRWRAGSGTVGRGQRSRMSGHDDLGSGDYAEIQVCSPVDGAAITDDVTVGLPQSGELGRLSESFPRSHVSRTNPGQNGATWQLLAFLGLPRAQPELTEGLGLGVTPSFPAGAHRLRTCWGHIFGVHTRLRSKK